MKRFISRLTKVILVVTIPFFILTLIELLTEITGGKIGDYLQKNYGISTRTMVIGLLVLMLFSLAIQIWDKWNASNQRFDSANAINQQGTGNVAVQGVSGTVTINNYVSSEKKPKENSIEPDLKILYDSLKERYNKRYDSKLDGRFEITLEVNEDWRFDRPATYKFSAEAKISEAVAAVSKAFDDKGRLLIVGNAGSGKTVLLLKLALGLLGDGYEKDKQIPVIFNLASWRDTYENFEDWLIEVLNTGNGLSKDFAKIVLREKRLIFLLDGLDELARNEENAHEIRAKCMESLNDYLREGRRTVICCRREEFAAMQKTTAKDAPVSAKVEVLDLTKADIILALQQARNHHESRAAAENLEKLIETNEIVLEVLSTLFYFTTALEVFDKPKFNDDNLPTDADELKTYLLKNYVDNKIKHTAKLTEFEKDKDKINYWLIWLANYCESHELGNFELSNLKVRTQYELFDFKVLFTLSVSLLIGFSIFLTEYFTGSNFESISKKSSESLKNNISATSYVYFAYSVLTGITSALRVSIVITFIGVFLKKFEDFSTEDNLRINFFEIKKISVKHYDFILGIVMASFVGIITLLTVDYMSAIISGVSCLLFISIIVLFDTLKNIRINPYIDIATPYERLFFGSLINITFISLYTLIFYLIFDALNININRNFKIFTYIPLEFVLIWIASLPISKHIFVRLLLWHRKAMPLKYATFLDLAAEARILEKDGGQWRFRHQNLQEYFAELEPEK